MPVPLLDLRAQYATIENDVVDAIMRVVKDQTFILGPQVAQLEDQVAKLSATRFAIACASGTDALLLALKAVDIGRGDDVVTTPFTFFATASTIHNVGARPVFADIDPDNFNISPQAAVAATTPATKAIVPVDLFGQMAPIDAIFTALPNLPIIEDAAQSIGATREIGGRAVLAGEAVTMGTFSFFPSKNLGGYGDGGMIVTQDESLAMRLRKLRVHGGLKTYYHEEVGFNSRLDSIQAAVLLAKLPYLESWSAARRRNASYYDQAFADLAEVRTPKIDPQNVSIYNQYTLRAKRRDALVDHLKASSIGHSIYYPLPLHLQPCFEYLGYREGQFPESEKASKEVISLPIYPELTEGQLDEVVTAVKEFYGD
jgi:dTDP-4-amino-4,6-dideoxygalactose transaminase